MRLPLKKTTDIEIQDNLIFLSNFIIGKPIVYIDGKLAIDKTDYENGTIPVLRSYDYYAIPEFYLKGQVIITNVNLFGHEVRVEYYTVPSTVKIGFNFYSFGGEPPAVSNIIIKDDI